MDRERNGSPAIEAVTAAAGKVTAVPELAPAEGQRLISADAYVASVLQTGKIVGNAPGETELTLQEGGRVIRRVRCFVDGGQDRLPLLSNRYNGVAGPVGRLVPLVQREAPEQPEVLAEEAAAAAFGRMYEAAKAEGVWLLATSGWRSLSDQERTIARYTELEGEKLAMERCAPAGFSEHHTGLALDVNGGVFQNGACREDKPAAWKWLGANCWRFGFMIKNLPGKEHITGTRAEPWHVRYLGDEELCRRLSERRLTLDEYIDSRPCRLAEVIRLDRREYEHARAVAVQSGEGFAKVLDRMARSRDTHGVSFAAYERSKLYRFSEKSIEERGRKAAKLAAEEQACCQAVCAATGRAEDQVRQDLAHFNTNPYAKVTMTQYCQWELYRYGPERAERLLRDLRDRTALTKQLKEALEQVDRGERGYEDIAGALDRYYQITESTLTAADIEDVRPTLERVRPDILADEALLRRTVADMLVCKRLMGFWDFEYFLFGFMDKSIAQRRTFVSNNYRTHKLNLVNNRRRGEIFDNKALTYEMFGAFYGRELISVRSWADRERFEAFCRTHRRFVKKPVNEAMGHGIGLVEAGPDTDIPELFASIYDEAGPFICEEVIEAHPAIRALNPDSVNTVRMSTFYDRGTVRILWPFMKIGRAGSFVDNGGAGGILAAIDPDTGVIISSGVDEDCNRYERHPDNGTVLRGCQLPGWDQALELCRVLGEAAHERVPEVAFIGWDFTCAADGRWIVVEGNALTQMIGQQAPLDKGIRAELDSLIPG